MKRIFLMLVALLAFGVASAQTDKAATPASTTEQSTTKVSEPQPLQKANGRVTAPTAKVPVTEKRKEGDGKGPIKRKPAPPVKATE